MKKITSLLFLLLSLTTFSQIKGTVTDKKGLPIPFANIYVKDTYTSTTSNEQGNYELNIKMEGNDMHEDYAVWLRILRTGITAYGVNEPLLIYRIHRNSRSWNKIKTINMTYKVFRFIGLNPVSSAYFMVRHVIGAIKKYKRIYGAS